MVGNPRKLPMPMGEPLSIVMRQNGPKPTCPEKLIGEMADTRPPSLPRRSDGRRPLRHDYVVSVPAQRTATAQPSVLDLVERAIRVSDGLPNETGAAEHSRPCSRRTMPRGQAHETRVDDDLAIERVVRCRLCRLETSNARGAKRRARRPKGGRWLPRSPARRGRLARCRSHQPATRRLRTPCR